MKWDFFRSSKSTDERDPNQDAIRTKKRSHIARLNIVYALVFAAFASLILRLAYLQISQGSKYRTEAMTTTLQPTEVLPARGRIFDTNGNLLAGDEPLYSVYYTRMPGVKQSVNNIAQTLAPVFHKKQQQVVKLLKANPSYAQITVFKNISWGQLSFIESHLSEMPGITVEQSYIRNYPYGDLAGHVLGYVSPITAQQENQYVNQLHYQRNQIVGQSGIEQYYEKDLQGTIGYRMLQVNMNGTSSRDLGLDPPPVSGENLQLTLDGHVQAKAQEDIMNAVQKSKYKNTISDAAAVMLDVKTGGVLAMVSYPYYDPNWYENGQQYSKHVKYLTTTPGIQSNNAIQNPQKPGSTVKPANLITGLKHGVIQNPTIPQYVPYQIKIGLTPKHDDAPHGVIDAAQAITQSSDVFFYEVGLKLGKWFGSSPTSGGGPPAGTSYQKYLNTDLAKGLVELYQGEKSFGLGSITGIDLPYEQAGIWWYMDYHNSILSDHVFPLQKAAQSLKKTGEFPNESSPVTLAMSAIGQEQAFTPIQMAQYVATIANNGVKLKPHLLKAILAPSLKDNLSNDKVIKPYKPVVQAKLKIKPEYLKLAHEGMYGVTHSPSGTAYYVFQNAPYDAAGKTGTADISLGGHLTTDSVFIAYAPYKNPQVAVAVMVPGAGYGSETAAPIAKDMMDIYFKEHHAKFIPKKQWTNTNIPSNWKKSPAYTVPEHAK